MKYVLGKAETEASFFSSSSRIARFFREGTDAVIGQLAPDVGPGPDVSREFRRGFGDHLDLFSSLQTFLDIGQAETAGEFRVPHRMAELETDRQQVPAQFFLPDEELGNKICFFADVPQTFRQRLDQLGIIPVEQMRIQKHIDLVPFDLFPQGARFQRQFRNGDKFHFEIRLPCVEAGCRVQPEVHLFRERFVGEKAQFALRRRGVPRQAQSQFPGGGLLPPGDDGPVVPLADDFARVKKCGQRVADRHPRHAQLFRHDPFRRQARPGCGPGDEFLDPPGELIHQRFLRTPVKSESLSDRRAVHGGNIHIGFIGIYQLIYPAFFPMQGLLRKKDRIPGGWGADPCESLRR